VPRVYNTYCRRELGRLATSLIVYVNLDFALSTVLNVDVISISLAIAADGLAAVSDLYRRFVQSAMAYLSLLEIGDSDQLCRQLLTADRRR